MTKERNASVIIDATLIWPNLTKLNDYSGRYQVDMACLSDEDVVKLEGIGLKLRHENKPNPEFDRGVFITVKSTYPIDSVEWNDRSSLSEDELAALGNGTTVRAQLTYYDWTNPKKKSETGRSPSLISMVVKDYKEYQTADNGDAFPDEMFDTDEELVV